MALKELISRMHGQSFGIIDAVDMMQKGFIYNSLKVFGDMNDIVSRIHNEESALAEGLLSEAKSGNPTAAPYIPVPAHLNRICEHIEDISSSLSKKIKEDILFSDKAVDEINFLFEKTKDILSNTSDMILARNRIVAGYVAESEADISRTANDFSTKHEERLIEGLCLPKALPIYLEILDAFKAIAWHAKEIVKELRG